MSRRNTKFHPDESNGTIIPSIHSPCYHGTRVPEGQPGEHRPLVGGHQLARLMSGYPDGVREAFTPRRPGPLGYVRWEHA
jgi:hypothetical protein